jgi:hypothetical protein
MLSTSGMEQLTARDAEKILAFVAEADALAADEPFTPPLLAEFGRLVPADWVTYSEQDRVRKRGLVNVHRTGDEGFPPATFAEGGEHDYWKVIAGTDPVCNYFDSGRFPALKLGDFFTRREFQRTQLAELWFGPAGINHTLNIALPSPPWHTKTFMFRRIRGDFTERDRLVLERLQPHLERPGKRRGCGVYSRRRSLHWRRLRTGRARGVRSSSSTAPAGSTTRRRGRVSYSPST